MKRRDFLSASMMAGFAGLTGLEAVETQSGPVPAGPVTLYYEIRVAGPETEAVKALLGTKANVLKAHGLLRFSMKQMVGDSTMVKNYPETYKGILASAYKESAQKGTLPYFYALFFRFDTYDSLKRSGVREWFAQETAAHFHAYRPTAAGAEKLPMKMDYYEGIFETVVAGDMEGIYRTDAEIQGFLKNAQEGAVTVGNHVTIGEKNRRPFETKVSGLLKTAQNTYHPASEKENGLPGKSDNRHYKRAVTTEILRNAFANGDERSYIMHGTWESVWDHENSHLDPRFKAAAGPVGSFVIAGPVEPFYETTVTLN